MMSRVLVYIGGILLLAQCQTIDFPEPGENSEPIFSFEGTIGGEPIQWFAGNDNYEMVASYQQKDPANIQFEGVLKPADCTAECPNSLQLVIQGDPRLVMAGQDLIESATQPGMRDFLQEAKDSMEVMLKIQPVRFFSHQWKLEDRNLPVTDIADHRQKFVYIEKPSFTLVGESEDLKMRYEMSHTFGEINNQLMDLDATLKVVDQGLQVKVNVNNANASKPVIAWQDGSKEFVFNWKDPELREIRAKLEFDDGSKSEIEIELREGFLLRELPDQALQLGMRIQIRKQPAAQVVQANRINLVYRDGSGQAFSTLSAKQPENSQILIDEVEEFMVNENGQPTKKIRFRFNCRLGNRNGEFLELSSGRAVFAVSYPQ